MAPAAGRTRRRAPAQRRGPRPTLKCDHRERRSGVPAALERRATPLEMADLGFADYVAGDLAVVRKSDRDLGSWQRLAALYRALDDVVAVYPRVVVVLQRVEGAVEPVVRRGVLARLARRGIPVLEAQDADDAAAWIDRLTDQEARGGEDGDAPAAPGRKGADVDRLAEQVVAWLPGVSGVGARRLLDHFGSVRAVAAAGADELRQVPGIGPKRSAAIVRVMTHPWRRAEPDRRRDGG